MNIAVVYCYAAIAGQKYDDYASRYLEHRQIFPAGMDHQNVVVVNGRKVTSEIACMFSSLPNCVFLEHDNSGFDIGAFQLASREIPADLMIFFGASTFFHRKDWLTRMVDAYEKHGIALYGAMGNRGNLHVNVHPHIRTTAFWMPPKLMNAYPIKITEKAQRHPFEHGKDCLTAWITRQGRKALVVTWRYEFEWKDWDSSPNGFHRGNQSEILAGDHLCEPPYYPTR